MWPAVHSQVMTGLIIAQVVLTFVFAIKKAIWAPILSAITIFGSIIFNNVVKKRFFPPQEKMSFRSAADGDHSDKVLSDRKPVTGRAERGSDVALHRADVTTSVG